MYLSWQGNQLPTESYMDGLFFRFLNRLNYRLTVFFLVTFFLAVFFLEVFFLEVFFLL